ncbi:putative Ig domain-containing protein [Subtercola boreus]|nr:putative Ig domain-containing protein [Subtercola boreus]
MSIRLSLVCVLVISVPAMLLASAPFTASAESWRYFKAAPAFATSEGATGVAVDASKNLVYAANRDAGSVTVFNGETGKPIGAPIAVGSSPWAIAVNSTTHKAYVTDSANGNVYVISGDTLGLIAVVGAATKAYGLTVDEVHNRVYVLGLVRAGEAGTEEVVAVALDGSLDVFSDSRQLDSAPALDGGAGLAVDTRHDRLFAVLPKFGRVVILRASSLTPVANATVPRGSRNVATNSVLGLAYVSNVREHSVTAIDGDGWFRNVIKNVSAAPSAVCVDEATNSVFVTDSQGISFSVIDSLLHTLVGAPVEVGRHPSSIAFDRVRSVLWVANPEDHTLIRVAELSTPDIFLVDPPVGRLAAPYFFEFRALGSPAPTFTLTSGVLPRGLMLDATSGILSGNAVEIGTFSFTVSARNLTGIKSEGRFSITVTR